MQGYCYERRKGLQRASNIYFEFFNVLFNVLQTFLAMRVHGIFVSLSKQCVFELLQPVLHVMFYAHDAHTQKLVQRSVSKSPRIIPPNIPEYIAIGSFYRGPVKRISLVVVC